MSRNLERTTFEISRELEFFSEKELQMQIGHGKSWWPVALLKELIDNALDACEPAGVAPVVEVEAEEDAFTVRDNGPGLPAETVEGSLDYLKRVSDKAFYVSPTRGQLGNALKTVWAAPFVANGGHGRVEVWSRGLHHVVEVSVNRIEQRPAIDHTVEDNDFVKNGTRVKVCWPDSACLLTEGGYADFYDPPRTAQELVEGYAAFNPHATFRLAETTFEATDTEWQKWKPNDPTSPHWYNPTTLRDLIAAYVAHESGQGRTVREFVSEFRGLSGTAKQKQVISGLSGVYLRDLVREGDVDMQVVERLLASMRELSRPVKPAALGVVGQEHFRAWMVRYAGVNAESVRYVKKASEDDLPYVIEAGFGMRGDEDARRIVFGLNWSPCLGEPTPILSSTLADMRVDTHDPVTVAIHLVRPRFDFTDRGKMRLQL